MFAFNNYWSIERSSAGLRSALLAASVVLAILSWRFVETPVRVRRLGETWPSMLALGLGGLAASAACSLLLILQAGFSQRFSDRILALDAAKNEALLGNPITTTVTLDDAVNRHSPRLGASEPAPSGLMMWGDSHARSIVPAVDNLAQKSNLAVLTAWHPSTPPVLGYVPDPGFEGFSLGDNCPAFNQAVLDHVAREQITAALLAARLEWVVDPLHSRTHSGRCKNH